MILALKEPRLTASDRAILLFAKHAGPVARVRISPARLPAWDRLVTLGILVFDGTHYTAAVSS